MNSPQGSQRIENWLGASIAGIISVDDNRNIVFWNKGAENIFQYSSEEIIGQPIMVLVPPDRLEKEAEKIVSALNTQGFLENHQTVG
ncbi:MAG TPA: PAS domain-containing protein, partial [Bdellovibrionota bacterium]|nr:PAS domain-containing protein [Bdellovibrionota bacterium]